MLTLESATRELQLIPPHRRRRRRRLCKKIEISLRLEDSYAYAHIVNFDINWEPT